MEIEYNNDDECIKYAKEQFKEGNYYVAATLLLSSIPNEKFINQYFSLLSELEEEEESENLIFAAQIGFQHLNNENTNDAKAIMLWMIGRAKENLDDIENAKENLELARKLVTEFFDPENLSNLDEDIKRLNRICMKNKNIEKSNEFIIQGNIMMKKEMYKEAIELYDKSLICIKNSEALLSRAKCWDILKDYCRELNDLKEVLKLGEIEENYFYDVLYNIERIYMRLEDYKKAIDYLINLDKEFNMQNSKVHNFIINALVYFNHIQKVFLHFILGNRKY